MKKRAYVSSVRSEAAAEKRDRVIEAAAKLLREDASIARFSLDTVAKAAGVTRLTVYNQFGSRRGLLEAVFDDIARRGGLHEIADAMAMPGPLLALKTRIALRTALVRDRFMVATPFTAMTVVRVLRALPVEVRPRIHELRAQEHRHVRVAPGVRVEHRDDRHVHVVLRRTQPEVRRRGDAERVEDRRPV